MNCVDTHIVLLDMAATTSTYVTFYATATCKPHSSGTPIGCKIGNFAQSACVICCLTESSKSVPMTVSEPESNQVTVNDAELLRDGLKVRLARPISVEQLANELARILKDLGTKPVTPEMVASCIASKLAPRFRHPSQDLERLIANRPAELAAALEASFIDDLKLLAQTLSNSPKPKKPRAKPLTEEERRRNRKASKNRYERRERQRSDRRKVGRIEQEFTIGVRAFPLTDPLNKEAPTGPCLDTLLNFGEVPMSGSVDSLESLFGVNRHNLPKSLPHIRIGQRIFYEIGALVKCIMALLESGRWLQDPGRRKLALSGIIQRARDFGYGPKLATVLEQIFHPYLT